MERRKAALLLTEKIELSDADLSIISEVSSVLELVVLELISAGDNKKFKLKQCAVDVFRLLRVIPLLEDPISASLHLLRLSSFAIIGGISTDASRFLDQIDWPELPFNSVNWGTLTWATVIDIWQRLIRNRGWEDRIIILQRVADLRKQQNQYEKIYMEGIKTGHVNVAFELLGLYHLAAAAEAFVLLNNNDTGDRSFQARQKLKTHFDCIQTACGHAHLSILEPLAILLNAASVQILECQEKKNRDGGI